MDWSFYCLDCSVTDVICHYMYEEDVSMITFRNQRDFDRVALFCCAYTCCVAAYTDCPDITHDDTYEDHIGYELLLGHDNYQLQCANILVPDESGVNVRYAALSPVTPITPHADPNNNVADLNVDMIDNMSYGILDFTEFEEYFLSPECEHNQEHKELYEEISYLINT